MAENKSQEQISKAIEDVSKESQAQLDNAKQRAAYHGVPETTKSQYVMNDVNVKVLASLEKPAKDLGSVDAATMSGLMDIIKSLVKSPDPSSYMSAANALIDSNRQTAAKLGVDLSDINQRIQLLESQDAGLTVKIEKVAESLKMSVAEVVKMLMSWVKILKDLGYISSGSMFEDIKNGKIFYNSFNEQKCIDFGQHFSLLRDIESHYVAFKIYEPVTGSNSRFTYKTEGALPLLDLTDTLDSDSDSILVLNPVASNLKAVRVIIKKKSDNTVVESLSWDSFLSDLTLDEFNSTVVGSLHQTVNSVVKQIRVSDLYGKGTGDIKGDGALAQNPGLVPTDNGKFSYFMRKITVVDEPYYWVIKLKWVTYVDLSPITLDLNSWAFRRFFEAMAKEIGSGTAIPLEMLAQGLFNQVMDKDNTLHFREGEMPSQMFSSEFLSTAKSILLPKL